MDKFNKQILFQGDSWAEANIYNKTIVKIIDDFSTNNKLSVINAGTTSYSFSTMSAQLRHLKKKYKINPDTIVAIIDHTDLADEICRYKDKINIKNNRIESIKPENEDSQEIYNYNFEHFKKIKNILEKNHDLIKNQLILLEIIKFKLKNKNKRKCTVQTFFNTLDTTDEKFSENLKYFKKIANLYLDEVFFENKENTKLILVIHPWKIHENKKYFYYAEEFKKIISKRTKKEKIYLLDFKDFYPQLYTKNNIDINDIHVKNDPTSHLTPRAQVIFLKTILNYIKE